MKMKRLLFILFIAGLMFPAGLIAQKVYKDASNRVILDSSATGEGIGLPAGAVTSTKKYVGVNSAPASGTWLDQATNQSTGSINATVYQKLEIATKDLGTSGLGSGTMTMTWQNAYNACKGLSPANTWRLPTQRELMLIWIFKDAIESFTEITNFDTGYYWSSTENTADLAWYVSFSNGRMSNGYKTGSYRVRCVREL